MTGNAEGVLPAGPYVVLGGPPYEPSANQTSLQMFDAIGSERPILYVCRRYQGSILRRIVKGSLGKAATKMQPGLHQLDSTRFVLILPWIVDFFPLIRPEVSRKFVAWIIVQSLRKTLSRLGWARPTLVAYWWMFPEMVNMGVWGHRVFDVIDRHWGYAYEIDPRARQRSFELAAQTANVADQTTCVSSGLVGELNTYASTRLLPNAINLDRVMRSIESNTGGRSNTAVYAGGWNERLDVDLLWELVRRNPDWQFEFVGAVPNERFAQFSNVEFFGDVSYDTVLDRLCRARIGLIPFVSNAFTEASSLLKVLDYLACGVMVGATNLHSLREWQNRHPDRFSVLESIEAWDDLFGKASRNHDAFPRADDFSSVACYGTMKRALALVAKD